MRLDAMRFDYLFGAALQPTHHICFIVSGSNDDVRVYLCYLFLYFPFEVAIQPPLHPPSQWSFILILQVKAGIEVDMFDSCGYRKREGVISLCCSDEINVVRAYVGKIIHFVC